MHQILELELSQHGLLSRRRHPALIGRIDAAVKRGALVPLMPGTYAPERTFNSLALGRMPGRAANPRIARLIQDSRDGPWSALERQAHRMLRAAGIRGWRANHKIPVPWGWIYADIAFPVEKVVVELDGWEFHQARTSFVADRRRDVALHLAGWSVLRFTAHSMEELVPQCRQHLKRSRRSK